MAAKSLPTNGSVGATDETSMRAWCSLSLTSIRRRLAPMPTLVARTVSEDQPIKDSSVAWSSNLSEVYELAITLTGEVESVTGLPLKSTSY